MAARWMRLGMLETAANFASATTLRRCARVGKLYEKKAALGAISDYNGAVAEKQKTRAILPYRARVSDED